MINSLVETSILFFFLTLCTISDIRSRTIPNKIIYPLILIGLAWPNHPYDVSIQNRMVAAVAAYAILWAIGEAYFRLKDVEGLGIGDAKFAAAMGAWLGWRDLPTALLIASLSGILYILVMQKATQNERVLPFAPALSLGFMATWIFRLVEMNHAGFVGG